MFQSAYAKVPDVQKIAVVRANALGDFILALPALDALRAAYPQAEIVLLALQWHASFLVGRPGPIDRVVVIPPCEGVSAPPGTEEDTTELEDFFAAMRRERFDLAIQMHGGGRYSNPFLLRLGARMTVGLKTPDAAALDRWMPYIYFQHEVFRYLEVVALVGVATTSLEPRLSLVKEDLMEVRRVVSETNRPLVALHPGAGDPQRRWLPEKFAAVGDALAKAGAQIVVTGTGEERWLAETVIDDMQTEAQNACDCLSLGGLAGLLSRCKLMISNDSGPLHLAAAVGTATVGIYWCFNFPNVAPITRTRHRPVISWNIFCPVCGTDRSLRTCEHHASSVAAIKAEEVLVPALDLFSA